jgi:hypothetical protein
MIKTVNGSKLQESKVLHGLVVSSLDERESVIIPKTYTKEEIPAASRDEIPTPAMAKKWKHLARIADEIHPLMQDTVIGLLIGTNCPKAIEPRDVLASKDGGPFAIRTFAGWTIVGPLKSSQGSSNVNCQRIAVKEVNSNKPFGHHFAVKDNVKEILVTPRSLAKRFEQEFNESRNKDELGLSQEDRRFLEKVTDNTQHINGHYQVPLPFKEDDIHLPNNRSQAEQRANWLKRKLVKDDRLHKDYVNFMEDTIEKDYARKVPSQATPNKGKAWYIPHHAVYHSKKPDKIRVVFDCSSKYQGTSLNDKLLQGPDLTSSLVGVLSRFRQHPVAFMSDVEAMFHQVRVPEDQEDFLRFFGLRTCMLLWTVLVVTSLSCLIRFGIIRNIHAIAALRWFH